MAGSGTLLAVAWRVAPRVPAPVVRAAMSVASDVTWVARTSGVRRLEANLARVEPTASRRRLRHLSRAGLHSYLRYFGEVLRSSAWRPDQVSARARAVNAQWVRDHLADGGVLVAALGHLGNYDLAGAWGTLNLGPVTTVAERLASEHVFADFLAMRESLGMRILPLGKGDGSSVFRTLLGVVRRGPQIVPLLADRDLTAHGVEVRMFGEPARVAAGPAALACSAPDARLCVVAISYERLHGERRRAAGSPWGLVLDFSDPLLPDASLHGRARVGELTQRWVDVLAARIAAHPQDWHMMQKVFVADLDPARLPAVADPVR